MAECEFAIFASTNRTWKAYYFVLTSTFCYVGSMDGHGLYINYSSALIGVSRNVFLVMGTSYPPKLMNSDVSHSKLY